MNKIGFFLGAGAEVDYGFPSGFEFAKQIFSPSKNQKDEAKKEFGKLYDNAIFSLPSNADLKKISKSIIKNRIKEIEPIFDDKKNKSLKEKLKQYCEYLYKIYQKLSDENQKLKYEKVIKFNLALYCHLYSEEILDKVDKKIPEKKESVFSLLEGKKILSSNEDNYLFFDKDLLELLSGSDKDNPDFSKIREIIEKCFDYQSLFEEFDCIFAPEKNKPQFKKIVSLLFLMKQIIISPNGKVLDTHYYEEINDLDIKCICTTNYSTKVDEILNPQNRKDFIFHLNGSVNEYFEISSLRLKKFETVPDEKEKNKYVPFMFPQVKMKPILSSDLLVRYAKVYQKLSECDKICILGFAMNKDDILLNGIFRNLLIENKKLEVVYLMYKDEKLTEEQKKNELCKTLSIKDELKNRFSVEVINGVEDVKEIVERSLTATPTASARSDE